MVRKKLILVFLILFFPSVAYLLMHSGKNHFRQLEKYGPKEVGTNGDTLYHTVPSFRFTDQKGKTFTDKELAGKVYVANFFFATCPDICPKMNNQVKRAVEKYRDNPDVAFVSFTVNPDHDSASVLADYAAKLGVQNDRWWFLTGDKESIYRLAENGYLVYAAKGKGENDFFHSQDLILVDKEKRIRGIYDGVEPKDVDTLIDEINVLLYEYKDKNK
jgi:protein SCO1/2